MTGTLVLMAATGEQTLRGIFQRRYGALRGDRQVVFRCDGGFQPDGGRWAGVAVEAGAMHEVEFSEIITRTRNPRANTYWYYSGSIWQLLGGRVPSHWNDACAEGASWIAALEVMLNCKNAATVLDQKGIVLFTDREPLIKDVVSQRIKTTQVNRVVEDSQSTLHFLETTRHDCNWEYLLVLKQIAQRILRLLKGSDRILCIAHRDADMDYNDSRPYWLPDLCCNELMQENSPIPPSPLPFRVDMTCLAQLNNINDEWTREIYVMSPTDEEVDRANRFGCRNLRWFFMDSGKMRQAMQSEGRRAASLSNATNSNGIMNPGLTSSSRFE